MESDVSSSPAEMTSIGPRGESREIERPLRSSHALTSLLLAGLVLATGFMVVGLIYRLGASQPLKYEQFYCLLTLTMLGLSFVPIAGMVEARKALRTPSEPRRMAALGVAVNTVLLVPAGLVVVYIFVAYFYFGSGEGVLTVNGGPVSNPFISLSENCADRMVYGKPETWCDAGVAYSALVSRSGAFWFAGIPAGDYNFHASFELFSNVKCISETRALSVQSSYTGRDDKTSVLVSASGPVSMRFGFIGRRNFDVRLDCVSV